MIEKFYTKNITPVPAVTKDQMIEVDRIAMEETGPNLFQMMENAGRSLAELTITTLGSNWKDQSIVVLAGTGGNGGGGICAARHLSNKGADVTVCITDTGKLKDVPAYQLHILKSTNARLIKFDELSRFKPDLIIDAIIGYGLARKPKGIAAEMINWASKNLGIKISLDVPSGVDSTTGEVQGKFINPDLTMTLALPKTGLIPEVTGELFLADIGIPQYVFDKMNLKFQVPFYDKYLIELFNE